MSINDRAFGFAQIGYIIVVLLALLLLPGADLLFTSLSMAGVWIIVSAIYQSMPWRNREGWWTLLIATTILSLGIITNVHHFTTLSGGTAQLPTLLNPDAARYYNDALNSVGNPNGIATDFKNHGYGLIISWIWGITGVSIVPPLILNMLLMLMAIIMCGGIAWRVLRGTTSKSGRWIASCAMIMATSVCYFLNSGTLLLKEAGLIFAFSLIGLAMTSLVIPASSQRNTIIFLLMFALGAVILSFLRYNYLLMPIIGIIILVKWQRNTLISGGIMALTAIVCWITTATLADYHQFDLTGSTAHIISGTAMNNAFFLDNPGHTTYNNIVDGYFSFPWWKKCLLLPMTAAVQYLIPLPWGFSDDIDFGYTLAYAHVSYPWYAVGALILFYFISAMRRSPDALRRLSAWGALMWLVPAFLFAGTVSRYTLPMLPLLIPSATYIVATWKQHTTLKRWLWCYTILLIIGLASGFVVQKGLLP